MRMLSTLLKTILTLGAVALFSQCQPDVSLQAAFETPPETAKPGVYWYFMDGNLSKSEMTKDLESMKAVGINHVIFLEVGIGVPRGPMDMMSPEWQDLFVHAVRETERLEMRLLMGAGPGWCGSGGPWVKPEESMHHLVFSELRVTGGQQADLVLPVPEQRSTVWHTHQDPYYQDVIVFAIPAGIPPVIADINEKALYERDPYSSKPQVKAHLPSRSSYPGVPGEDILSDSQITNLSGKLDPTGRLVWDVPEGEWTVIRMGTRVTGASTRPSPEPVIGLESNKLNAEAFLNHLKNYTDVLLEKTGAPSSPYGWQGFHVDSWESGAQNWTEGIVEEFINRRGYDPEIFLITFTGRAVQSVEQTERFLWDWRKTCQELLLENHAAVARDYAHQKGLELTIEPYDMNPAGDIDLGSYADVIMAEFWSDGFGFKTAYAVMQATSISHLSGRPVVGAEVFTANSTEAWQQYPGSMKDQSDWALAMGVNRFAYHTFAHKPLGDSLRPGMSMGSYGIHWDRGQTWWELVGDYHTYISRCSHMMQQGQAVSDILYLTPEGAPMVFTPPADALFENRSIPDKKGYGFDGCSPIQLMDRAFVENGKISFPGASSYEILVLPTMETMTPELLQKIRSLVQAGGTVVGSPPKKSPSLSDYPDCDSRVIQLARELWGSLEAPDQIMEVPYGKGRLFWGGSISIPYTDSTLYPSYTETKTLLERMGVSQDFESDHHTIRYGHRRTPERDIFFVANRTDEYQHTRCVFRAQGQPEYWNPVSGEIRRIRSFTLEGDRISIPLEFFPYESFFIVFNREKKNRKAADNDPEASNNSELSEILTLTGSWDLSFDPAYGGPEKIAFDSLMDWTAHEIPGIQYYSGIASYHKSFQLDQYNPAARYYLDLGVIHEMGQVMLNGQNLGVVWCAPWRLEITEALKAGENTLKIRVANRWINRLLGDRIQNGDTRRTVQFKNGLLGGKPWPAGPYTFTLPGALRSFHFTEPLPAGLVGPVQVLKIE